MKGFTKAATTAALTVCALFAFTAAAHATAANPAGHEWEAVAKGDTWFIGSNGTGGGVRCQDSTVTGIVPGPVGAAPAGPAYNYNATNLADAWGGSGVGPITSTSFTTCNASFLSANVTTTKGWTLTASAEHTSEAGSVPPGEGHPAVAINVPPNGAQINIPAVGCTMQIPNDQDQGVAASVFGTFVNGTKENPVSKLYVKGNLPFVGVGCGFLLGANYSQAIFYANGEKGSSNYAVSNVTDPTQPITIDPTHP